MTERLAKRWGMAIIVVGVAIGLNSALIHARHRQKAAAESSTQPPFGVVDELLEDTPAPNEIQLHGWALAGKGIAKVELVVNGEHRFALQTNQRRDDVARVHPTYPQARDSGYSGVVRLSEIMTADEIRVLDVIATDRSGTASSIGHTVKLSSANVASSQARRASSPPRKDAFYLVMATSNVTKRGAADIEQVFRPFESATVKVGVRLPILYMRTTRGRRADFQFDPAFDIARQCGGRPIAEDNLQVSIAYSIEHRLPVLFTLNGGVWADSACDSPDWDVTDFLETDVLNCQWNNNDAVMADDYLKNLAGSLASPELARALTFNVYAKHNRFYKKRNLQQAARIIGQFALEHPDLFIGVNLDPDNYVNPFFEGSQWYDYNPGTLRQFREWLRGGGPYAGATNPDVPNLSGYRRQQPLSLDDVNAMSGQKFRNWDEVVPPRALQVVQGRRPFWKDPWFQEWEHFRRHLVALHYDELSKWVVESGIGPEFVYTAQGFMPPGRYIDPFPIAINSPAKNYDTGGMSIEGSIPAHGHLGAILYGASSVNQVRMEGSQSLFSVFRMLDPGWAVVEYNPADLTRPDRLPDYSEAYRSLREMYNYGARFVSPMAWNGSRGTNVGKPGFAAHMALRDTPLQEALKQFLIDHAGLPVASRLWTFGHGNYGDSAGWRAGAETIATSKPGALVVAHSSKPFGLSEVDRHESLEVALSCLANCVATMDSPPDLAFRPKDFSEVSIDADGGLDRVEWIALEGEAATGGWSLILPPVVPSKVQGKSNELRLTLPVSDVEYSRVRLTWATKTGEPLRIRKVGFLGRRRAD